MHTDEIETTIVDGITYNDEPGERELAAKLTRKVYFKLGKYKADDLFVINTINDVLSQNWELWHGKYVIRVDIAKDKTWSILVREQ